MPCPQKNNCDLFPLLMLADTLQIWMKSYCDSDYNACERYKISLEGRLIPLTLLPNGKYLSPSSEPLSSTPDNQDTEADKDD